MNQPLPPRGDALLRMGLSISEEAMRALFQWVKAQDFTVTFNNAFNLEMWLSVGDRLWSESAAGNTSVCSLAATWGVLFKALKQCQSGDSDAEMEDSDARGASFVHQERLGNETENPSPTELGAQTSPTERQQENGDPPSPPAPSTAPPLALRAPPQAAAGDLFSGPSAPSALLSSVPQGTAQAPPLQPAGAAGGVVPTHPSKEPAGAAGFAAPPRPTVKPTGTAGEDQLSAPPRPAAGPAHAQTSPGHPSLPPSSGVSPPASTPPLHSSLTAATPPTPAEAGENSPLRAQPGAGEQTDPQAKLLPRPTTATLLPRQPPLEITAEQELQRTATATTLQQLYIEHASFKPLNNTAAEPKEQHQQPDPNEATIFTPQIASLGYFTDCREATSGARAMSPSNLSHCVKPGPGAPVREIPTFSFLASGHLWNSLGFTAWRIHCCPAASTAPSQAPLAVSLFHSG
ncbi:nascent polypeptide-associated complex subunit alpha, muscle-specific form-like isoform X2 [Cyanistes caeruleus]|uniref:nascent polypeptide-associated complex subunit alpha, muscle-specific form-like isoform X2 n=1 Tax=Cyanistes caeruleus TaxID=156563 RepID=UPI000CDA1A63|nr:nascent polypeptide-associated complex subunit alpha, muscle-specific form-like isoform X2 [Cyanistes caeruleus]